MDTTSRLSEILKKPAKAACKQQGVVLFFALIALVVMSLAAVALIRSVDTSSMIAGNLSFKQSTMLSADRGIETAMLWIDGNLGILNANSASNGYYATSDADAKTLVDNNGVVDVADDGQGNAISYVVQRMCRMAGPATAASCLLGPVVRTGSNAVVSSDKAGATVSSGSTMYRVTAKVVGPKNTVSYIQAFVYQESP